MAQRINCQFIFRIFKWYWFGVHLGRFQRAQRKPKPPMPGSQLIVKPNKESANYRPAIERTNAESMTTHQKFQGIAMQQSNGMKQQQLQHGMHHRQKSRGRPHGSHVQQRLQGNIVKKPSTSGVFLFIEWQCEARLYSLAPSSPSLAPNLAPILRSSS